jgi:uroporphyrin-III C-methyltransferase/precorrin-2 dehydrogenase/sirohydrochlorin ferrochelatase
MPELLPLFLNLTGRLVVLVGGGPVATSKLRPLLAAGARVHVVAPEVTDEIAAFAGLGTLHPDVTLARRPFEPDDLDEAWLVVAAATPEVNRQVADVAATRRIFVNAVDDPANASAFLSGVVRRDGVTLAISTSGDAPALTALLREGLDALLPGDLASWVWQARAARVAWRREGVAMNARKPRLLQALNALYEGAVAPSSFDEVRPSEADARGGIVEPSVVAISAVERGARVPWLNGPEDSWL